jgi:hypothetical protein
MAYFDLQTKPPNDPSEIDYEDRMPTHVIWGDVESVSPETSHKDSGASTLSADELPHTNTTKKKIRNMPLRSTLSAAELPHANTTKKKIRNMPLRYVQKNQDTFLEFIHFRQEDSSNTSKTESSSTSENGKTEVPLDHTKECKTNAQTTSQSSSAGDVADNDMESDDHHEIDPPQDQQQQVKVPHMSPTEIERVLATARKNAEGVPMSLGSAGHLGDCKPCLFYHTEVGCSSGIFCEYCHFSHPRGAVSRPSKAKRDRYRRKIEMASSSQNHSERVLVSM